jgi:hypothetical protein
MDAGELDCERATRSVPRRTNINMESLKKCLAPGAPEAS